MIYVLHVIRSKVFAMKTVVTSRIDSDLKERVANILQDYGLTTSEAIRKMFEEVAVHNAPDYLKKSNTGEHEMKHKVARLNSLYVHGYEDSSEEELSAMRIEERHASSSRH